jgi:hypothetical protein
MRPRACRFLRMKRRLLNLLTLMSLLLCVAVATLSWLDVGYRFWINIRHGIGQVVSVDRTPHPSFCVVWFPNGDRTVTYEWALPYWKLLALSAAGPLVCAYHRVRSRRPHRGHCSRCGYDLRATPGRCPECGP